MSLPFKIIDESDTKEYFAIVPYIVVNHSDHWEQSLYLQMKRYAGENKTGSCFATQETLAKAMKASQPTVARTLKKLVERGWIELIGTRPGKTRPVSEYRIVDLWQLNMETYGNKKILKPQNKSSKIAKDTQTTEYKIPKPQNIEEETYRRRNNNIIAHKKQSSKDIHIRKNNRLPEEKQTIVHRLVYYLEDTLGTQITNWGKQGKAIKMMMRSGYTEEQIKKTIKYMATNDDFFADKGFDLMTVANNIPRYKAMAERKKYG